MPSTTASKEVPSYSSSRVQRAARLNNVETAKLLQQIQYLEKAKQHQCRVTNQDIRLVSMSIDYIRSHSGNSQEAWRPPSAETDGTEETTSEGPCFMYGERIISRKVRRLARPMSAIERSTGNHNTLLDDDQNSMHHSSSASVCGEFVQRPKSCSTIGGGRLAPSRSNSVISWLKSGESNSNMKHDDEFSAINTNRSGFGSNRNNNVFSRPSSAFSVRDDNVQREPWEDDTSEITKKILKSQARAQSGKRSLYQSPGSVMTAQSSKTVRDLARKIRINQTQISYRDMDPSVRPSQAETSHDKPPQRAQVAKDVLGRRATFGDIMNQRKPTLSAKSWRQRLNNNANNISSPLSSAEQQKATLEAKKRINEERQAGVQDKVRDFVSGQR